jgi:hypothetical protein
VEEGFGKLLEGGTEGFLEVLEVVDQFGAAFENGLGEALIVGGVSLGQFSEGHEHGKGVVYIVFGASETLQKREEGFAWDTELGGVHGGISFWRKGGAGAWLSSFQTTHF